MQGRLITLEGGEGGGKSTLAKGLQEDLRAQGIQVVMTREPGGTPGAEEIRELLVKERVGRWDAVTEALLLFAARRNLLTQFIQPKLQEGVWVICDRFYESTLVYQGLCGGVNKDWIEETYRLVSGNFYPDMTVLLDIDPRVGLARTDQRFYGDAEQEGRWYEEMSLSFHDQVREGFLQIAHARPERYIVVDATHQAAADIRAHVMHHIQQKFLVS